MEAVSDSRPSHGARRVFSLQTLGWALLGVVLIGYGLISFNAGTKVSPLTAEVDSQRAAMAIDHIVAQSDQGVPMLDHSETRKVIPFWIRFIAWIESSEYAMGSDSVMEAERHYQVMPESKKSVISTHMMLGMILMTTGFFQFWPAFRRKHRKVHRAMGMIYVLAAVTSMSMSGYYLSTTAIEDVYSQFIFYAGLWALLAISMTSIAMATWSILRRDIASHLGWQAVAFGCFLTAPIQRGLWVGLSPFSDGATFNEINIAVNVVLLPLAFLAGYALFCINRASSPLRPGGDHDNGVAMGGITKTLVFGLTAGAILLTAIFLGGAGLGASEISTRVAMPAAAEIHDATVMGYQGVMAGVLITAVMVLGLRLLLATGSVFDRRRSEFVLLSLAGLLASALFLSWGHEIGMPSHEQSLAGVAYGLNGLLLALFVGLAAHQFRKADAGKFQEALKFVVMIAAMPALLYVMTFVVDSTGVVPAPFDSQGHGYQLAAAVALLLPILLGHILAVHSGETGKRAIN